MSDDAPNATSRVILTGAERQFLVEASNKAGRVAGHNNQIAVRFTKRGLVRPVFNSILGQSNYHITAFGEGILRAHEEDVTNDR